MEERKRTAGSMTFPCELPQIKNGINTYGGGDKEN
jgi:hypothetical protein